MCTGVKKKKSPGGSHLISDTCDGEVFPLYLFQILLSVFMCEMFGFSYLVNSESGERLN